jgi:hypothetical protein
VLNKGSKRISGKKLGQAKAGKRLKKLPARPASLPMPDNGSAKGRRANQPHYRNSENAEEREQRLAKREALTIRAFQMAYDNYHKN